MDIWINVSPAAQKSSWFSFFKVIPPDIPPGIFRFLPRISTAIRLVSSHKDPLGIHPSFIFIRSNRRHVFLPGFLLSFLLGYSLKLFIKIVLFYANFRATIWNSILYEILIFEQEGYLLFIWITYFHSYFVWDTDFWNGWYRFYQKSSSLAVPKVPLPSSFY